MDITTIDTRTLTLLSAGSCVVLSIYFTVKLLSQHFFYWKNPKEQKAIVIIVLMAPIYAFTSFVGLLDIQGSDIFFTFLESIKECYEALAIAKFMALMYSYLNISLSKDLVPDEIKGRELHNSFPMNIFLTGSWNSGSSTGDNCTFFVVTSADMPEMLTNMLVLGGRWHHDASLSFVVLEYSSDILGLGRNILRYSPSKVRLEHKTLKLLKYWTWQFVVLRPICSVLMITMQLLGWYPSWVSWIFTIVLNISVTMALYALLVFYHVFAKELAPHKPFPKFMCIKGVVFFCFWQGILLELLTAAGIIRSHHFWLDVEHIQEALQNVLVIVEMVCFSVFQQYAYHVAPYSGAGEAKFNKKNE